MHRSMNASEYSRSALGVPFSTTGGTPMVQASRSRASWGGVDRGLVVLDTARTDEPGRGVSMLKSDDQVTEVRRTAT